MRKLFWTLWIRFAILYDIGRGKRTLEDLRDPLHFLASRTRAGEEVLSEFLRSSLLSSFAHEQSDAKEDIRLHVVAIFGADYVLNLSRKQIEVDHGQGFRKTIPVELMDRVYREELRDPYLVAMIAAERARSMIGNYHFVGLVGSY